ncbi:MAG: cation transport regulator ChaB [Streptosporangiales bacterium]|nr:cation transport regulator ChaB [Streptosporangiales bacterium]
MPGREELPSTLRRSSSGAQKTWIKAHDSAVDSYGEGERAHRTAFAALKHSYEKVGDKWVAKRRKGPSDSQAKRDTPRSRDSGSKTAGGVDAEASKSHLYDQARKLDIPNRSKMTKKELVSAIQRENRKSDRKRRSGS